MRKNKKEWNYTFIINRERFDQERKHRKLTLDQVADKVNITRAQLCNLRTGKYSPSATTMASLVRLFDISVEELFINKDLTKSKKESAETS